VKYLWLYVENASRASDDKRANARALQLDDWLNVVDEAASLGAHCVIVCVQAPLGQYPDLWRLCQWAQTPHDMMVGLYSGGTTFEDVDIEAIKLLDLSRLCLFVDKKYVKTVKKAVAHEGIAVCSADVDHEEHAPPCSMPEDIICVGAEGNLYTCGLVLGNEEFNLGNVFEKPLHAVVEDDSLPRHVPADVPHNGQKSCTACPPLMAERVMRQGAQAGGADQPVG